MDLEDEMYEFMSPRDRRPVITAGLQKADEALIAMRSCSHSWPFKKPVKSFSGYPPDYSTIVGVPMDLRTIQTRLTKGDYVHQNEFISDVNLMFFNCRLYNKPNADVYIMCRAIANVFRGELINSFTIPDITLGPSPRPRKKRVSKKRIRE
ncbi:hypothetical protein ACOME3_004501 [Neoechinorhynchus agilis]